MDGPVDGESKLPKQLIIILKLLQLRANIAGNFI
jgi:hypothetical protein